MYRHLEIRTESPIGKSSTSYVVRENCNTQHSAMSTKRFRHYHRLPRPHRLQETHSNTANVKSKGYRCKQDIHKRMVRFQKLLKNVFFILHGHNIHCQQWELSKFLMRCQQFASHAYNGAAGPQDQFPRWRHSRRRLPVSSVLRCTDLRLQCSVSFVHGLKNTLFLCGASFLNRARNSRSNVIRKNMVISEI
jgi:hypothetical protein